MITLHSKPTCEVVRLLLLAHIVGESETQLFEVPIDQDTQDENLHAL